MEYANSFIRPDDWDDIMERSKTNQKNKKNIQRNSSKVSKERSKKNNEKLKEIRISQRERRKQRCLDNL